MNEKFESKKAPESVGAYPHAKRVGDRGDLENCTFITKLPPTLTTSRTNVEF